MKFLYAKVVEKNRQTTIGKKHFTRRNVRIYMPLSAAVDTNKFGIFDRHFIQRNKRSVRWTIATPCKNTLNGRIADRVLNSIMAPYGQFLGLKPFSY